MGGGLELALHCHYRTLSAGAAALALPEVFLGLIPGWGGTQLLPNLIGIPAATQVIIQNPLMQNKMLKPKQAAELGIADVLLEPADFLERSLEWAAGVVRGEVAVTRPEVDKDMWAGVLYFARQTLDQRLHGAVPAAYKALDLLETAKDADFATGTAAEDEALADLVFSEELRSGLYAFDLVQRRAKRPAGAPDKGLARPVTKVGIVGAGLMASQLALLFARRLQVPVVLTDLDQARVDKGVAYVHAQIEKPSAKGRMDKGTAAKLYGLVSGSVDKARLRRRRLRHRGGLRGPGRQEAGLGRAGEDRQAGGGARHQHVARCRSPRWPRIWRTPSGWSASTSSTRSRCCRCWRSSAASAPTTPPWPPPSRSASS